MKAGADIVAAGDMLYALKGNKTLEFWRYVPYSQVLLPPRVLRSGATEEKAAAQPHGLSLSPNPLSNARALLRYGVPQTGPATLRIIDVAGRMLVEVNTLATRTGSVSLDLCHLSAGGYMVELQIGDFTATQKLVVQR